MNIPEKKPDFETESFRMWKTDKLKDKKKIIQEAKDGLKVYYKGDRYVLHGFTEVSDKEKDKLVFAYKFKHNEKMVVYHIPDGLDEDESMRVEILLKELRGIVTGIGYSVENINVFFENVYQQKGSLKRL